MFFFFFFFFHAGWAWVSLCGKWFCPFQDKPVNDVKRMNFCQDMSSWEREIDFDPCSVGEVKKNAGSIYTERQPSRQLIRSQQKMYQTEKDFWFSNLTFKDPNTFKACRLHTCIEEWEKVDTPDFVLKWLKQGVSIVSTFKHFKGNIEPRQANLCLRAFRHDKF